MLYLIIATIILYFWLKGALDKNIIKSQHEYLKLKDDYASLRQKDAVLKEENQELGKKVDDTVGLYDVTKDICKTLEVERIFGLFSEEVRRYVRIKDCQLLKSDADLTPYKEYAVFPLRIDSICAGYLAVEGVEDRDREKFDILFQQFLLGIKRALLYQQVQELAITDSLTHAYSRRYALEKFREELQRSKKYHYSFSCFMVDIDHFKDCNDHYGHLVGDAVLRGVAQAIKENIRQVDLICRYGGEEFLIILAETDKDGALFVAERIRQDIEHKEIKAYDEDLKVTISIGIAVFPAHAQDVQKLISSADEALYQAKESGRNRVCVYSPSRK